MEGKDYIDNKICVEYSYSQDCFHIENLGAALKVNRESLLTSDIPASDYQIIAIFSTYEEASVYANVCREVMGYKKQ